MRLRTKPWKIVLVSVLGLGLGIFAYQRTEPEFEKPITNEGLTDEEKSFVEQFPEVLYGGRPAGPGELLASVSIGNCTGTIVGPDVLLTAGHCRSTNSRIGFRVGNQSYSGVCERHPLYDQGAWLNNDFALCKFSPSIRLERYGDLKPRAVKVGDIVTMQGYGRGSNGVLNWGNAVVARMNNMDIVTSGNVRLGGGDSGGALFKRVDDRLLGPLHIVGVNSRGNNSSSFFNITALDRSQAFFIQYAKKHKASICGISWDCDPEPFPPKECDDFNASIAGLEVELFHANNILMQCREHKGADADKVLIGGRLVEPGEFDNVVRITMGNSSCTATFVSENVLLTAAHCGPHRGTVRASYDNQQMTGTCYHHPMYPGRDVDVMACKLSQAYDVVPATVAGDPKIGDIVTLVGYGCTQPGGGGADGRKRVGNAQITGFSAYDIISKNGAALCFGDSGGPMFQRLFQPAAEAKYIIGVNSKGNIRDTNYNLRLDLDVVMSYLRDFEATHDVKICGVGKSCQAEQPPVHCPEESAQVNFIENLILEFKELKKKCEIGGI